MKIAMYIFSVACLLVCFIFASTKNIPMAVFWGVLTLWNKSTYDHFD